MTMGRRPKAHKDKDNLYYFSEEAKSALREQAVALGYVAATNKTNCVGLADYINAIAHCQFMDQRPPEVIELDVALMDNNRVPLWSLEYERHRHSLRLSPRTKLALYKLALAHCIANPRRGNSIDSMTSVLGCLFEAVGIGWLTPIDPPSVVQRQITTRKAHDNDRGVRAAATAAFYRASY